MTLILVGAGGLGRKIAAVAKPVAFVDQRSVAGLRMDGVPVLTMADALDLYSDATWCVTIWGAASQHRIADTERDLRQRGVRQIVSFASLLRQHGLSHYFIGPFAETLDAANRIHNAEGLWADAASRAEYRAQVTARLTGAVGLCGEPVDGPPYFPDDLYRYRPDEVVLDGGAYNGDTLYSWCQQRGADTFARWLAFEPHPDNARNFTENFANAVLPLRTKIILHESALGAAAGYMRMTRAGGTGATASTADDAIRVPVFAADALEAPNIPTFIKLDIEGAELDAIEGMRSLIQEVRPVMAVCVYHHAHHLWDVPLAIARLMPDAKFYLRPYMGEGWETVCFAVPPERAR